MSHTGFHRTGKNSEWEHAAKRDDAVNINHKLMDFAEWIVFGGIVIFSLNATQVINH